MTIERRIMLEGSCNFRDVGGYSAQNGSHVRWGRLYRSDALHQLTPQDQVVLADRGIQTVVDLRFDMEIVKAPNIYVNSEHVQYTNINIFDKLLQQGPEKLPATLEESYRLLLDHCGAEIRSVFSILAYSETYPLVIHCSVGKDRTGVIIALALALLGVSHETIIEDYLLTTDYIAPIYDNIRRDMEQQSVPPDIIEELLSTRHETMAATLAYLESQYGDAEGYLISTGMQPTDIETIRLNLLDS